VAKDFPVTQLVEFRGHKATAWCHEDKTPSLWYANRVNRVVCPVCDKKFNAIDICMERDGMSFIDAVKFLNGR
jgi:DNA primase